LRRILVVGAHSVLRRAKENPEKYPWLTQLLARRPFKVVAVALANKMARIAWALVGQRHISGATACDDVRRGCPMGG
jgi:transposase